jgi:hypothetical protein
MKTAVYHCGKPRANGKHRALLSSEVYRVSQNINLLLALRHCNSDLLNQFKDVRNDNPGELKRVCYLGDRRV